MVRFSTRSFVDVRLNELSQALTKRHAAELPVWDLTVSNPTQVDIQYPVSLLDPLGDPRALQYVPDAMGLRAARQAVAADYAALACSVSPDRILLTASTSEAYAYALKLLCEPGDEVLVPQPSYPLLEHLASYESVRLVPYRLRYDGGWHVDYESLRAALSDRTRAVVVIHPNNPTGHFIKRGELAELARLGVPVIADEVFARYRLRDVPNALPSALAEAQVLTLALGGLSKSIGLPQLKLAWMALAGPDSEVDEALRRLSFMADAYLSVATPVQLAAPELLRRGAILRDSLLQRARSNLAVLERRLPPAGISVLFAEGGWSAVLRLPAVATEMEWVLQLLECDGVLVQPGYFYDFDAEPFVVVSLLTPPLVLEQGIDRLIRCVNRVTL